MGLRHKLTVITVLDEDGIMNDKAGKYEGMDRYECRKALVEELQQAGYLEKSKI